MGATPPVFLVGMRPPFPRLDFNDAYGGREAGGRGAAPPKNRQGPPSKGRLRNVGRRVGVRASIAAGVGRGSLVIGGLVTY